MDPSLCRPLIFKQIKLMTSTWAHFEEQTQLSKMRQSLGLQLNLLRSNRFPRWMLILRMKAFPFHFCRLPKSVAGGQGHKQVINKWRVVTISLWTGGQGRPTPVCTSIPPKHPYICKMYSKTLIFPLFNSCSWSNGLMDQQTNGQTDGQIKLLIELRVRN